MNNKTDKKSKYLHEIYHFFTNKKGLLWEETGINTIDVQEQNNYILITIHCTKAGMLIGKGGSNVRELVQFLSHGRGKKIKIDIKQL